MNHTFKCNSEVTAAGGPRKPEHSTCSVSRGHGGRRTHSAAASAPGLPLAVSNVYLTDDVTLCVLRFVRGGSSVLGCPVYTECTRGARGGLLDGLPVDSEPVETRVLGVAPVGQNSKLHDLESSFGSFLKSKGRNKSHTCFHTNTPKPSHSPDRDT